MKFVPPKKIRIFNYQKISTSLLLETKGLEVIFKDEFISEELLNELEEVFTWCMSHTEVKSILLTSKHDSFLQGINHEEIKNESSLKIKKLYKKLNSVIIQMINLPQTIVVDLKNGAKNEGITLSLACDVRISALNPKFQFNHLSKGLIYADGLISVMAMQLNSIMLKSLILSETEFSINEINLLGAFTFNQTTAEVILQNINGQSNISRAQTKCHFALNLESIEKNSKIAEKLLNATLKTEDFKIPTEFKNLRELKTTMNQYLVPNPNNQLNN